jgi:hypothetical protein
VNANKKLDAEETAQEGSLVAEDGQHLNKGYRYLV